MAEATPLCVAEIYAGPPHGGLRTKEYNVDLSFLVAHTFVLGSAGCAESACEGKKKSARANLMRNVYSYR